jgi:hypothetical protein
MGHLTMSTWTPLPHEKATVLIDQERCRAIPATEASLTLPFIPRWA